MSLHSETHSFLSVLKSILVGIVSVLYSTGGLHKPALTFYLLVRCGCQGRTFPQFHRIIDEKSNNDDTFDYTNTAMWFCRLVH
jgi:hypothetical protein